LVGLSDRSRTEVERDSGMPPEKAAVEARRRMVEGIAFGSVTYEDYRAWADAPDDKRVVFPTTSKGIDYSRSHSRPLRARRRHFLLGVLSLWLWVINEELD